ncbi:MAG: 2-dehydropantoate 2-reductase [Thermodesulfobacteriota bacterium]
MKIAVVGPGALGCLMAAYLSNRNETWLLDHNRDRAALLDRQGVILEREKLVVKRPVRATSDPKIIGTADLILLCIKSYSIENAILSAKPLAGTDSLIIPLQNGIGHLSLLPRLLRDTYWGLGVTSHGATLAAPGHVLHRGKGLTRIGFLGEDGPAKKKELICRAASALTEADIETEIVPDIRNHIWAKLMVNIGINALTAIYDCPNGALLESAEISALLEKAVQEGIVVARQKGITFAQAPLAITRKVCQDTAANISSMLQDVRAGRKTEIDAINGALVNAAEKMGIGVPINKELVRKVKEIEAKYNDFT